MKKMFFISLFLMFGLAHGQVLRFTNPRLLFDDPGDALTCVSYNYPPNPQTSSYFSYWTFTGSGQNTCDQSGYISTVEMQTTHKRSGTGAYKFHVRYTGNNNASDARAEWGILANNSHQFNMANEWSWTSVSLMFPAEHTFDSVRTSIAFDMKEGPDDRQTPFYLALKGKRFALYGRFVNGETPVMLNTCVTGVWYDFAYYNNHKSDASGIQRFYINGVLVWEKYGQSRDERVGDGITNQGAGAAPINRIQHGFYKWAFYQHNEGPVIPGDLIMFADDFKVGGPTATLEDMAAGDGEGGPVDQFPVANAGANTSITLPTSSKLMAASASDADGTIADYTWTQVDGPSTATINDADIEDPLWSALIEGTYIFRLTVTDDDGHTGSDDVTVIVLPSGAPPPAADPVFTLGSCDNLSTCTYHAIPDRSIQLPATTDTFVLYAAPTDLVSTVGAIEVTQIGTTPAVATIDLFGYGFNYMPEYVSFSITGLTVAGTYTFRATAETDLGGATADTFNIVVGAEDNLPPDVSAGADQFLALNDYGDLLTTNTTLTGTATDGDGSISLYEWSKLSSNPSNAAIGSPNTISTPLTGLGPGTHTIRFTATDNSGAQSFDDITITVLTANAGQDTVLNSPFDYMNLIGYASAGKDVDSVRWRIDAGGVGAAITNPTSLSGASISDLPNGQTTVVLTIYYEDGIIANSKRLITYNGNVTLQPKYYRRGTD